MNNTINNKDLPIGVFDYGMGGLTVIKSISNILPNESFVFFADEAMVNQKEEETKARQHHIENALRYARFLAGKNIKMLVVGCNLMSCFAIDELQRITDVPVIGLVTPGIVGLQKAVEEPETKKIAVFTTEMAAYLNLFSTAYKKAYPGINVTEIGCGSLPNIIDKGLAGTEVADSEVLMYAEQVPCDISAVLLTCTRFPILLDSFRKVFPDIPIIDPAVELAEVVKAQLEKSDLVAENKTESFFYTTGDIKSYSNAVNLFFPDTNKTISEAVL